MSKFVLTNAGLIFDAYRLTSSMNAINLNYGAEAKDCTVMGDDTRSALGGLKTVQLQAAGYYDAVPADSPLFTNIGVSNKNISVIPEGSTVGDIAYFFKAMAGEYSFGETIGEVNKFSLGAGSADGPLVRGQLLNDSTETVSGDGTAVQVGAAASGETIYAVLHVLDSSGSGDQTLDVTIGSDDNGSFTSETNRFTFTQATTSVTSELLTLTGPITDDYWRVNFTIAGSGSPSFDILVILGIQ